MSDILRPMDLYRLQPSDEAELREHHANDGGYLRCVICRLLASLDYERDLRATLEPLCSCPRGSVGNRLADDPACRVHVRSFR